MVDAIGACIHMQHTIYMHFPFIALHERSIINELSSLAKMFPRLLCEIHYGVTHMGAVSAVSLVVPRHDLD